MRNSLDKIAKTKVPAQDKNADDVFNDKEPIESVHTVKGYPYEKLFGISNPAENIKTPIKNSNKEQTEAINIFNIEDYAVDRIFSISDVQNRNSYNIKSYSSKDLNNQDTSDIELDLIEKIYGVKNTAKKPVENPAKSSSEKISDTESHSLEKIYGIKNTTKQKSIKNVDIYTADEKETEIYKCKACGSNLIFFPRLGALACLYCGKEEDFEKDNIIVPLDFDKHDRKGADWRGVIVYRCNSCGAKEIISKGEIVKSCSFCGTSNIVVSKDLPGISPNAVIPFKISIEDAKKRFLEWVKKGFFTPAKIKKLTEPNQIKGIYSPGFSFNSDTQSSFTGNLGEFCRSGKYTDIRYFRIKGKIGYSFKNILIGSGAKLTQKIITGISPFPVADCRKYDKKFLSGFSANNHEKDIDISFIEAKTMMSVKIENDILSHYTYDVVDHVYVNTNYSSTKFNHILFPVYICNYSYKKKNYNVYINGATGKIFGEKPRSKWQTLGKGLRTFLKVLGILVGASVGVGLVLLYMYGCLNVNF